MNWVVVGTSAIVFAVMAGLLILVYTFMSARTMKKRRMEMVTFLDSIKPGKRCVFGGGIQGKITAVHEDTVEVEIAKGMTVTVNKLGISDIVK